MDIVFVIFFLFFQYSLSKYSSIVNSTYMIGDNYELPGLQRNSEKKENKLFMYYLRMILGFYKYYHLLEVKNSDLYQVI